ncbi:hypothetical protein TRFO_13900 [Tritrichomonas foetus]|uniref:Uncharacterized protein n=1 Tax=Tritrichomonas foetus TaxID=1144522 RepID=A0A1J4KX25_9EUKA|nr:hypothetical protein TRFO_13900 [Tritrichomonas foetus]|eukprot:OHT15730.1 hypothetical protein TRFO_13900 [Tritrichomonas foetus]
MAWIDKTDSQPTIHLEVWISKNSEPLILDLQNQSSVIKLCYQLLSLYNYPPNTEIILKDFKTGREELHLSEIEKVDTRFNNKFLISFVPLDLHIDSFYHLLTNESSSSMVLITNETYKSVLNYQFDNMSNYNAHIFRHQLLYVAIRDIINGQPTLFSKCLPYYFQHTDNNALFPSEIIISVFTEILSKMFADKYEWISVDSESHVPSLPSMNSNLSEATNFSKFIVDLISNGCSMRSIIRLSLGIFRPASFIVNFIILITDELLTRFDNPTVSTIVEDLFGCKWLYESFYDRSSIETFLNHKNYFDLFPFLVLRHYFYNFLQGNMTQVDMAAIFMAYDGGSIWINKKASTAVYTSMFECIYEIIEAENSPCLVLSKSQHESILRLLGKAGSIFKKYLTPYAIAQTQFLEVLEKTLTLYKFEPKGLLFIVVDYFIQGKLLNESFLNHYIHSTNQATRESFLIELNTYIVSPLPNISFVYEEPKKK